MVICSELWEGSIDKSTRSSTGKRGRGPTTVKTGKSERLSLGWKISASGNEWSDHGLVLVAPSMRRWRLRGERRQRKWRCRRPKWRV